MAGQPARIRSDRRRSEALPRPRAALRQDRSDPEAIPPAFREKVDPAEVLDSLQRQVAQIRMGRARGVDGDDVLREIDEYIASLEK